MVSFWFSGLALLALSALPAFGQVAEEADARDGDAVSILSAKLDVDISTSFPASEIFGVKLVNGKPTEALISFRNSEPDQISVAFVGGSLWAIDPSTGESSVNVRNLTTTRYNVKVPAGEADSVSYKFATELHPQDLRLHLVAVVTTPQGGGYTLNAYNETVSVVEPDASFFDPQLIFLYMFLAAAFAGACYFIYNTWITTLFPQTAKKGGDRSKRTPGSKKSEPVDGAAGGDGSAVATGAQAFDASWIPDHHINKPEARRLKSGGGGTRPKSRQG